MQAYELRLGILSAIFGGILVASVGILAFHIRSVQADTLYYPEPETTALLVASPRKNVSGNFGPLYNSKGNIIAVSAENNRSAFEHLAGPKIPVLADLDPSKSKSGACDASSAAGSSATEDSSMGRATIEKY